MEKISYDPNKKYTWTPDDQFVISGGEFGLILNTLRAVLNTPEAARILLANKANDVVEAVLARGVESGIVTEAPEEGPQQSL
jgi:hypothetical protein